MFYLLSAVTGAVVFALVLRNNKNIASWFYKTADWVEVIVETKTGKDI